MEFLGVGVADAEVRVEVEARHERKVLLGREALGDARQDDVHLQHLHDKLVVEKVGRHTRIRAATRTDGLCL